MSWFSWIERAYQACLTAVKVSVMGEFRVLDFVLLSFSSPNQQLNGTVQNNMDGVKIQLEGEVTEVRISFYKVSRAKSTETCPKLTRLM